MRTLKSWVIHLTGAFTVLVLCFCSMVKVEGQAQGSLSYSDCHFRLLNFLQNGEFSNTDQKFPGSEWGFLPSGRFATLPFGERGRRIEGLLTSMEKSNVAHVMVCGMPFIKKWSENEPFMRPRYYLDSSSRMKRARDTDMTVAAAILDYKRKHAENPASLARLKGVHPFVCGFDGTDLGAVDLIVKRVKEFPDIWQGIGEIMSRHDDLTNLTTGERPRANHPALLRVCRFAGEHYLPVSIHHNISPISRNSDEVKEPLYLDELVELFRFCSWKKGGGTYATKFIWCHAGISRRIVVESLIYWIDELLEEFGDHVYIDLSWVVLENYVYKDLDSWVALIKKYPTLFMIGSDAVGMASAIGKELSRYEELLSRLPLEVRIRVARDNFADLMEEGAERRAAAGLGRNGLVLSYDYEFPKYEHTRRLTSPDSFTRSRSPSTD